MELFVFEINEINEKSKIEENKIHIDKNTNTNTNNILKNNINIITKDKIKIESENNYTSKKPIMVVENIYYFY